MLDEKELRVVTHTHAITDNWWYMAITHLPTGLYVEGEICGKRRELQQKLLQELEVKVNEQNKNSRF